MTSTPEPLPSLPPSPVEEQGQGQGQAPRRARRSEDVARAWHDDEPDARIRTNAARKGKGKGKGKARRNGKRRAAGSGEDDDDDDDDDEDEEEEESNADSRALEGYPPTKEEEAESRRVQENLRRWEVAERQRRKAARESSLHSPSSSRDKAVNNSPSLFADLFRRDSRKVPLGGVGAHHVLSTTDGDGDVVPLEDLDTPSVDRFSAPSTPEPENPFDTPSASRTSLNIPDNPTIMTESDSAPTELTTSPGNNNLDVPKRPTLEASSSFAGPEAEAGGDGKVKRTKSKRQPPPPKPLDLPAPKVPPPHPDAPHTARPPEPVAEPELDVHERDRDVEAGRREAKPVEDLPPMRWWHEWLCGCGEGPDRGGDNQAGRTNPFE